ncbi:MAG: TetR/AcrR family transcriptional regulator [Saprospiraceae bacterium]
MNIEKRTYNNTSRAKNADKSTINVIHTTGLLWTKYAINDITLEMIAEHSGLTIRTLLRKFGTKENLFEACLAYDAAHVKKKRNMARKGDIGHIVSTLIENYEEMGDASIRTIFLEPDMEIARKIGQTGRETHRAWCAQVFEPFLPEQNANSYDMDLTTFITATEVYLWKLLRRDLGKSKEETIAIFTNLLRGLVIIQHQKLGI